MPCGHKNWGIISQILYDDVDMTGEVVQLVSEMVVSNLPFFFDPYSEQTDLFLTDC